MEDKILEIIKEESENANVRKYTCINGFGYSQFERNIAERVVKLFCQPVVSKSLAPHRCPVCNGNGLVPNGFYMQTSGHWSTSSITPETCRSCSGTGIVWG